WLRPAPPGGRAARAARRRRGRGRRRRAPGRRLDRGRLHRRRTEGAPRGRRAVRAGQYPPSKPRRGAGVMAVAQETIDHLRTAGLADVDPEIAALLEREAERQRGQIELIASENFTWPSILEAVGS